MRKILINSYACSPNMGSEPGMGWNWIVNLALYCDLYVISEGEFKEQCEKWCIEHPQVGQHIHWYWNPVSQSTRNKCWNQGNWLFYPLYKQWQQKTAEIAREICNKTKIDILHQLNMIGFREPGYLWQVSIETGIPYIWGPVNAKEGFPIAYLQGATLKSKLFIYLKNAITKYQLLSSKRVHASAKRASFVIAASNDSASAIKKYLDVHPILINESGSDLRKLEFHHQKDTTYFDLLWVGRFIFTKQLILALRTLSITNNKQLRLHIVGGTNEEERFYKKAACKLGVAQLCVWYGKVSHREVQTLMQKSDLFFFTSIAEGTPHVILEALNNRLPILCFDTCGQGDCVTSDVGIKIPLTNPKQSIKDFAEKIEFLYHHRDILEAMSINCRKRAEDYSWKNLVGKVLKLYEKMSQE